MSEGSWAIGCKFQYENPSSPGVFINFPEAVNITRNMGTRENIDLTNHDSTPPFEEFVKGIATGAVLDITFNSLINNTANAIIQQDLEDIWLSETSNGFRIVLNDVALTGYLFEGFLQNVSVTHNTRDAHRGSMTIACTGAWTRFLGGS